MTAATRVRMASRGFSPLTAIPWHSAAWADDAAWSHPVNGAAVSEWPSRGSGAAAATETHLDATNGLYVPATLTRGARVDHHSSFNITGDLDFACKLKLDDWTPPQVPPFSATARGIIEKRVSNSETTTLAWEFAVRQDGTFQLVWVTAAAAIITAVSTAASGVTDGTAKWVRATLDVDNGASGYTVKFYLSDDGSSWTQLGADVTAAGVTNIRTNSSPFSLGVAANSADGNGIAGYLQRAVLKNGIAGTTVLDIDLVRAPVGFFTEAQGRTVVIDGPAFFVQPTSAKQPLYRSSTAALNSRPTIQGDGTDDFMSLSLADMAQPFSVVVVMSGATSGKGPVELLPGGWAFYWDSGSTRWQAYRGTVLSAPSSSADANGHMMRFYANGASSKIAEDETVLVTGAAGAAALNQVGLYDILPAATLPFAGHIAFVGLYAGDVTAHANWATFKAGIATHYGLTIA